MNTFRRPMFRGGKVDSRGTGITSGLSYNKGGRVGFFNGGPAPFGAPIPQGTGMNPTPTLTTSSTGPKFKSVYQNPFKISGYTPRQFAPSSFGQELRAIPGLIGQGIRSIGFNPATAYALGTLGGFVLPAYLNRPKTLEALKVMRNEPASTFDETAMIGIGDEPGEMDDYLERLREANTRGEKIGFMDALLLDPETMTYPKAFGRTEDVAKRAAIEKAKTGKQTENPLDDDGKGTALSPEKLRILELEKLVEEFTKTEPKAKDTDMEESIDIDKEKFAKALGRDKARGQDISDMLLSFSSKALAPDATVKSAFAEFAADEVKRPSRVRKIDDSAAALAINKYIKGEISKQEAETLIKRLELQAKFADERATKTAAEYIQASDASTFSGRVKEGLNSAYSREGIVPSFKEVTSKEMKDPEKFKFGAEDVGVIFIETDTKRAYSFDAAGNEILIYQG